MDELLTARFEVYESMPEIDNAAVAFVREVVSQDVPPALRTDEAAGMLVSHLVMALDRLVKNEPVESGPGEAAMAEVRATSTRAFDVAHSIAERVDSEFGAPLDPREIDFLALHFATLELSTTPMKKEDS